MSKPSGPIGHTSWSWTWDGGGQSSGYVVSAVASAAHIALDVRSDDGGSYTVVLAPAPAAGASRWLGRWRRPDGGKGHVDATRDDSAGTVELVGTWTEPEDKDLQWHAEFDPT